MATQLYKNKINFTPPKKNEQKSKAEEKNDKVNVSYNITPFLTPVSVVKGSTEGERKHYPQPTDRPVDKKSNPQQMKFSKKTDTYTTDANFSSNSTAIKMVKYNPETEDLKVKFKHGRKQYWFPEVPEDVVKEWANKNTTSKGKFFWDKIRPFSIYFPGTGRSLNQEEQKSSMKLMKNLVKNKG